MKRIIANLPAATAICGSALLAFAFVCYAAGARINTSPSIAVGLYWTSTKPVGKGDYVLICPPVTELMDQARRRGYIGAGLCPGRFGYLMKKVVATGEDTASFTSSGVWVNGTLLPSSRPLAQDRTGRALPQLANSGLVLGAAEVLLMSDARATAFDGRYFGLINRSNIKTVIVPVVTW